MKAKKSLGQHFLTNGKIIDRIVETAELSADDVVLEIGPGKGILTKALLKSGARVVAVEKDGDLIGHLQQTFSEEIGQRQLMLLHADVLAFNPTAQGLPEHHYKIVANIPYYITGEIVRRFLSETSQPSRMVLLVQKEVAERIVACPERGRRAKDGKPLGQARGKESILSMSVKLYGTPSIALRVPKKYFSPVPNVDSAVLDVSDIHHSGLSRHDEARFFEIVRLGFSQKRKQVLPLLSKEIKKQKLLQMLAKFDLPETVRAESLPLAAWLFLLKR
ncbi:MAG TPA: 16S rRNA (adenine(1518)-N(6)/adenine(1519)-N(6))-dimethyltransferase RsmA [Candidatus Paceibacterota bacterium]|nr:16S rRNA (adenine(1518)-N(6)/adenine(1519)-N(6))-dimethyltransferase RsmA [Candidatus Paceibacterota bacterium]